MSSPTSSAVSSAHNVQKHEFGVTRHVFVPWDDITRPSCDPARPHAWAHATRRRRARVPRAGAAPGTRSRTRIVHAPWECLSDPRRRDVRGAGSGVRAVGRSAPARVQVGRVDAGRGGGARAAGHNAPEQANTYHVTRRQKTKQTERETYERGRPRTIVHITPQSRTGRVRRRRLYGVPTRRRAHRLTRETCGAYASECVPCPDTPPLSTRIALGTMCRLPKYNMAPQRGAPPPLRCAPSTCHGPVMLMHAVDERRDATTPVPVG